ncbi:DsbA family protein [Roseobacter sp. HKCCA0434]|uniref:DsbA family protein n=1 Tax=Roseobacter sp. HKCCA0434 TaxID=3079297 RepID=UPI0029057E84|nr:DsbA family protein [Roseobacter sp. HKCCA0434]
MSIIIDRRGVIAGAAAFGAALGTGLIGGARPALAQDAGAEGPGTFFLGSEDAPVHVIEYASLTCPHCANFHRDVLPRLREDYIDEDLVRFEYREVYFDRLGLWGGMLARCNDGMRYFGIIGLLFERQAEWARADTAPEAIAEMRRIGAQAGLTEAQMDECMQDAEMAEALVAQYQSHMAEHEIGGTPSFVIDGELTGNMSYEDFSSRIEAALE